MRAGEGNIGLEMYDFGPLEIARFFSKNRRSLIRERALTRALALRSEPTAHSCNFALSKASKYGNFLYVMAAIGGTRFTRNSLMSRAPL